jgi:hypothetical protein
LLSLANIGALVWYARVVNGMGNGQWAMGNGRRQ